MAIETLEKDLIDASKALLKMAKDLCWNKISDDCLYIISEIKDNEEANNFNDERKIRKSQNNKKTPSPLNNLMPSLTRLYQNFYDINLYIYKSLNKLTIVDIRYYSKSSLDADYRQKVINNQPMLHCKIATPAYSNNNKAKFDINWEHKPLSYKWNMFLWGKKMKKEFARKKGFKQPTKKS